ncbi:MAG: hypothetical protein G01um101448_1151 [Parcubacteria group bacterium Gr01-1014_48]|nr:MAG: hypothetical protein G01um101448_1151 [Parcubacteria group bacterium Gr01-1014_48]
MEQINEKNTKKEIFDAYRELLQKVESGHQPSLTIEVGGDSTGARAVEKKKATSSETVDTLGNLQIIVADALAAFSRQAVEFHKRVKEEEETFSRDVHTKRDSWRREEEEYQYMTKMKRRQEEDDYALKSREKERQFNESIALKKQEIEEREKNIKAQEEELRTFRKQVELFPAELKKTIDETEMRIRSIVEREAKVATDLTSKDMQREQELAKLTIQGLEDTIKRQTVQIINLERQLSQAIERAQKLAVTVVEGSGRTYYDEEKKEEKVSSFAG